MHVVHLPIELLNCKEMLLFAAVMVIQIWIPTKMPIICKYCCKVSRRKGRMMPYYIDQGLYITWNPPCQNQRKRKRLVRKNW